jgi:OmpA-OmpF porin, OOP family
MKKIILCVAAAPLLLGNTSSDLFKDHDRSWHRETPTVSTSILVQLVEGMSRRQVRELIGTPHFNEGIIVRNWHYLFDVTANGRAAAKNCQFRIDFEKGRVTKMRWENPDCAQLVR